MKNIRAYITIQKELQSHLFQVSYHVDSSLYPCKIPVMILQPIVENAILHGLASSRKQDRSLSLSAFGKGRDMIFEIRDDGAGIEAEQLKQLPQQQNERLRDEKCTGKGFTCYTAMSTVWKSTAFEAKELL